MEDIILYVSATFQLVNSLVYPAHDAHEHGVASLRSSRTCLRYSAVPNRVGRAGVTAGVPASPLSSRRHAVYGSEERHHVTPHAAAGVGRATPYGARAGPFTGEGLAGGGRTGGGGGGGPADRLTSGPAVTHR